MVSTGCASGSFAPLPHQDQAEQIVWHDLYGESEPAPSVEWIDGLVMDTAGHMVGGLTLPGWKCQVSLVRTLASTTGPLVEHDFSGSSYAHELMHAHTYNRTGDVDAAHWRGDWHLADETAFDALWDAGL